MQPFFVGLFAMIVMSVVTGFVLDGLSQATTGQSVALSSVHLGEH